MRIGVSNETKTRERSVNVTPMTPFQPSWWRSRDSRRADATPPRRMPAGRPRGGYGPPQANHDLNLRLAALIMDVEPGRLRLVQRIDARASLSEAGSDPTTGDWLDPALAHDATHPNQAGYSAVREGSGRYAARCGPGRLAVMLRFAGRAIHGQAARHCLAETLINAAT